MLTQQGYQERRTEDRMLTQQGSIRKEKGFPLLTQQGYQERRTEGKMLTQQGSIKERERLPIANATGTPRKKKRRKHKANAIGFQKKKVPLEERSPSFANGDTKG